ncbi:MAG: TonB-dependent receptor, partial [Porticoccaceae bacterium]|nr:TonB-dependent receptor [Porticoccaceae bacterium]
DSIVAAPVSHTTTTLSGAAQWLFADNQHLSLSITNAERAPTVEELFSCGAHLATRQFSFGSQAQLVNDECVFSENTIDEEASLNYELGYHYHSDAVDLKAFVFYNDISDFIFQRNRGIEMEELPVFDYVQQDATFKGAEAELSVAVSRQFTLSLFGDYVRAELNSGGDIPRITPARFGTELEYQANDWIAKLRWTDVQDQDRPGDGEEATAGYSRVDANLSYNIAANNANYTLFLRGSNLLNESIRDATSFLRDFAPQAGRSFELGVRMEF